MQISLRPASTRDVETLFDIRCSVHENHESREELALIGVTPDSIAHMIKSGDYITLIADVNGEAAGFSMAKVSDSYVFACFVRPGYEGRGVGRAIMEAAEEGLRHSGCTHAWLSTGADPDLRAVGFYRHLGWKEDGVQENGLIRYIKKLTQE